MKACVVTGATGLIGTSLVKTLAGSFHTTAVSRRGHGSNSRVSGVETVSLDFSSDWDPEALPKHPDSVIHLAQAENCNEFPERADEIFFVNTDSTLRLLEYARKAGARTFILASSGGVGGFQNSSGGKKSPAGFYLGTKLCSEILAGNYSSFMNIIILRFFFVYGPGQRKERLIPRLIQSVDAGRPVTLHGPEGIRINPVYVEDAVKVISGCLSLEGSLTLNVAGPETMHLRKIAEIIGETLGKKVEFKVQSGEGGQDLIGDILKTTDLFGPPQTNFRKGIEQCIHSFQEERMNS